MAERYYKYVDNVDQFDGTERVIVERDPDTKEVTKELVKDGAPVQLSKEQVDSINEKFVIEESSAQEAKEYENEESNEPSQQVQEESQSPLVGDNVDPQDKPWANVDQDEE